MKKNIVKRIVIPSVVSLLLFAPSVFVFSLSSHLEKKFRDASTAELLRIKVDISKPGVYSGSLKQPYFLAHAQYVYIESSIIENEDCLHNDEKVESLLTGLEGSIVVKDNLKKTVSEWDLLLSFQESYLDKSLTKYPGWSLRPSKPIGEYQLTLTVDKPAKAYEGIEQYLVARYVLCGCEMISAAFLKLVGWVLLFIGLAFSIVTFVKASR